MDTLSEPYPRSDGMYAAVCLCWLALWGAVALPKTRQAASLLVEALQTVALFRSVGFHLDQTAVRAMLLADVTHFKFMDVKLATSVGEAPTIVGYYCDFLSNLYIFLCILGMLGIGTLITGVFSKSTAIYLAKMTARVYALAFTPLLYNLLLGIRFRTSMETKSTVTTVILAVSLILVFAIASFKGLSYLGAKTDGIVPSGLQEMYEGLKEVKYNIVKYWGAKAALNTFMVCWAVFYTEKFNQLNYVLIIASALSFVVFTGIFRPFQSLWLSMLCILFRTIGSGVVMIGAISLKGDQDQRKNLSVLIIILLCLMLAACFAHIIISICKSNKGMKSLNQPNPEDPIPTEAHVTVSEPIQSARSPQMPLKSALKKNRVFASSTSNQDSPPIIFDRLSPSRRSPQGSEVNVLSPPQRSPGALSASGLNASNQGAGTSSRYNRRHLTPPPNRLFFGGRISNLP